MGQTRVVDVTATLDACCRPADLTAVLRDLERYPEWLSILPRTDAEDGSTPPAWSVELRATIGPLARSKRLRMVRVVDEPGHIRFERAEVDGRRHSPWVLDAVVTPTTDGAHLEMSLHYGGAFGGGIVERLLRDEIESSRQRLRDLVERGVDRP